MIRRVVHCPRAQVQPVPIFGLATRFAEQNDPEQRVLEQPTLHRGLNSEIGQVWREPRFNHLRTIHGNLDDIVFGRDMNRDRPSFRN